MSKYATPITILYADDDAEDRMLVRDAWRAASPTKWRSSRTGKS